jgi:hypothetical protein
MHSDVLKVHCYNCRPIRTSIVLFITNNKIRALGWHSIHAEFRDNRESDSKAAFEEAMLDIVDELN